MTLYETVKFLCDKNGISIHAVEQTLGIGNGTIGKWRDRQPNLSSIETVAKYFGMTTGELLSMADKDGGE